MKIMIQAGFLTVILSILFGFHAAEATTHVIMFGGGLGFNYSPAQISVAVGDTIEWQGDFSQHPLVADEEPLGADNFVIETGTTFDYVVTLPGTYTYHCANHGSPDGSGMAGSFTATAASVNTPNQSLFSIELMPNPATSKASLTFVLEKRSPVVVRLLTVDGKEQSILANAVYSEGEHSLNMTVSSLAAGEYLVVLEAGGIRQSKLMVVTK